MTAMGPSKTFASAFVFLTILDALWIGEAQPCENFLASLVTPSALHHVNGAAVTLSGVNFHPSRVSTGLEDEKSTLENGVRERLASDVAICTFGAPNDSESFSKGVKIGEWSLACSLPSKIRTRAVNASTPKKDTQRTLQDRHGGPLGVPKGLWLTLIRRRGG